MCHGTPLNLGSWLPWLSCSTRRNDRGRESIPRQRQHKGLLHYRGRHSSVQCSKSDIANWWPNIHRFHILGHSNHLKNDESGNKLFKNHLDVKISQISVCFYLHGKHGADGLQQHSKFKQQRPIFPDTPHASHPGRKLQLEQQTAQHRISLSSSTASSLAILHLLSLLIL